MGADRDGAGMHTCAFLGVCRPSICSHFLMSTIHMAWHGLIHLHTLKEPSRPPREHLRDMVSLAGQLSWLLRPHPSLLLLPHTWEKALPHPQSSSQQPALLSYH